MTRRRSVVITGASTGIGRACALRMDREGWQVFAGVRREADAEALKGLASGHLVPVHLDVTDAASIAALASSVGEAVGDAGLDGLVNNAGATHASACGSSDSPTAGATGSCSAECRDTATTSDRS